MFLALLGFLFLGILLGVFLGIVPGLHPNFLVLLIPIFASFGFYESLVFLVSIVVSNTIIDIIPSVFLAAPDTNSELTVLPAHRMLLKGKGHCAVKLYVFGAYFSLLLCISLLPLLYFTLPFLYACIKNYIWILLVLVLFYTIFCEKNRYCALFVLVVSGIIGFLIQKLPDNNTIILFPVFSGFFGASILFLSKNSVSQIEQDLKEEVYTKKSFLSSVFRGTFAGVFSGFLPGIGTSQVASLVSEKKEESFLAVIGSIAVSNILMSIFSLWLIEKSRSGTAVILESISSFIGAKEMFLVCVSAVVAASLSLVVALYLSRKFSVFIKNIDYTILNKIVFCFIVFLIFVFSGFVGLVVFAVCLSLGIYTNLSGVRRGLLMSVLIIPTIFVLSPLF